MNDRESSWRLLKTPPANGAWNMAVDEAILESVGRCESPPTLRLFAWTPPCLSLGYAQSIRVVDEDRLRTNGWDLVRRSTGGGAILHTDELTYSVIGPADEPFLKGDILTSYQRLSAAILLALENLDLPAESLPLFKSAQDLPPDPVCFEIPSHYEITVEGKKLVGSAQARKKNAVLQHGTLPLHGDLTRITESLVYPDERAREKAAVRLLSRATTVESVLGKAIEWDLAADTFVNAFSQALNLEFNNEGLTQREKTRVEELIEERFGNEEWTRRV
ncbi:MAG: biotin/lipoate A/B protein ligase family protein [Anaerolineales bacterium]|jgi:lipoate-protein ligase A